MIADFDTHEVRSEPEALLLESRLIKEWKPKYNTLFTDDKRYPLVRVDMHETLPRFRLVRFKKDDKARYFGPFPHSGFLRKTLAQIRRQFGVLLADGIPSQLPDGRWRLYDDVRQELYGQGNDITSEEYRQRVEEACEFLEGKSRESLESLQEQMLKASEKQNYEKAADLRDMIQAIEKTLEKGRSFERFNPNSISIDRNPESIQKALLRLAEVLQLPAPPHSMECFDISHISGTFVVASMVHFENGLPDKTQYRRFRIKSFVGNDDFRSMEEVVFRRYKRIQEENRAMPDLVVIDGGIGQIGAALKAFISIGIDPPALIGLAKKHETIIFHDGREPLNLSLDDPALRLLQRLRDEAHRFANTYNADLRSRKIRESVLDDIPLLGPSKKAALFSYFHNLENIRSAGISELTQAPSIGPTLAKAIYRKLHSDASETSPD